MKSRAAPLLAEHVARRADAYIAARCYGKGNADRAFTELRRSLNRWRPRLRRKRSPA